MRDYMIVSPRVSMKNSRGAAHAVTVQVMHELADSFPNAEIFVHQDPAGEEQEHGLQV